MNDLFDAQVGPGGQDVDLPGAGLPILGPVTLVACDRQADLPYREYLVVAGR